MVRRRALIVLLVASLPLTVRAENGRAAWLRYAPLDGGAAARARDAVPRFITTLGTDLPFRRAEDELRRGVSGMLGRELRATPRIVNEGAIVVGTLNRIRQTAPFLAPGGSLPADGYSLRTVRVANTTYVVIAGGSARGALYGAFAWLRRVALGERLTDLNERSVPSAPVRWVNQWDNIDGSIERGYGGRSIFWANGGVRDDLTRVDEYGRLLASLGINGVSINNVNANPAVLSPAFVPQIARIADALRPWGVQVAIAVDFGSPRTLGGLPTFDPLDAGVAKWWKTTADALYAAIPDLGGFVLKADSEGRVGPSTYGRTHADAANVVARALAPHRGLLFYRGFVYDHHMDWTNPTHDRARAAYDNFHGLDGAFDANVIIQIKHGPIDFQVREPASPLFAGLERTNQAIELQITQEYFGQARHTVFLIPMWKEVLDFDLRAHDNSTPVKSIVAGRTFSRPTGGFVGVANVGDGDSWLGNHLSQANLYGFGRLAWNPDLSAQQIAQEWTTLTFRNDPAVAGTVVPLLLSSWRTYENYTGPLGLQTLTDIVGNHYGVSVDASERNGWGQWHRADAHGVGMDRSVATGTGFVGQYPPAVRDLYESLEKCPDDLLLFMHHVPYTHRLHSGTSVIQYIYDSHYEGAAAAATYARDWRSLKGTIDDERYMAVLKQLEYQAGQAIVWRDAVSRWFARASTIADANGRVGNYPGRLEAEDAELEGYRAVAIEPWEAASGTGAIECAGGSCAAAFTYHGPAGRHDVIVQYFDVNTGAARYRVWIHGRIVDEWTASERLPATRPDGSSSMRRIIEDVELQSGEPILIEATPDGRDAAAIDYIEIDPRTSAAVSDR